MKTITSSLLVALTVSFMACNSKISPQDVPPALTSGLLTTFPNATAVDWDKEGDNFEADFKLENKEHEALLSPSGEVLMYKYEVAVTEVPEAVKSALTQQYSGQNPDDFAKLFIDGTTYIQVEVEDESVVFTEDGQAFKPAIMWD